MRLLDTTVAIDHFRGRAEAVLLVERAIADDQALVASELLRYEVLTGARDREADATERLFRLLGWVAVSEPITRLAAEYSRSYRASHGAIDDVDCLVAATARLLDADLLTTNVRHFPMFEGLQAPY